MEAGIRVKDRNSHPGSLLLGSIILDKQGGAMLSATSSPLLTLASQGGEERGRDPSPPDPGPSAALGLHLWKTSLDQYPSTSQGPQALRFVLHLILTFLS